MHTIANDSILAEEFVYNSSEMKENALRKQVAVGNFYSSAAVRLRALYAASRPRVHHGGKHAKQSYKI